MARNQSDELTVHGIKVDSINEKNVAIALDRMKLEYAYQYYYGGTGVRGSQIIDFLVYTDPKPTPLFVHGEYWHTATFSRNEALKMSDISSRMRGHWALPVIIWENECETEDQAYNTLMSKL